MSLYVRCMGNNTGGGSSFADTPSQKTQSMSGNAWYTINFDTAPKKFILFSQNVSGATYPLSFPTSPRFVLFDVIENKVIMGSNTDAIQKISDTQYKMKAFSSTSVTHYILYS